MSKRSGSKIMPSFHCKCKHFFALEIGPDSITSPPDLHYCQWRDGEVLQTKLRLHISDETWDGAAGCCFTAILPQAYSSLNLHKWRSIPICFYLHKNKSHKENEGALIQEAALSKNGLKCTGLVLRSFMCTKYWIYWNESQSFGGEKGNLKLHFYIYLIKNICPLQSFQIAFSKKMGWLFFLSKII